MAPSNNLSYHVNGPVLPQCNIGTSNAYVVLGECQDGAFVTIQPKTKGIYDDGGGGPDGEPVEHIQLNAIVSVRFKLVPYSGNYVNKLRAMSYASATEGQLVVPGTLFGTNGYLPNLYLPYGNANDIDGPWLFSTCKINMPGSVNINTKESTPEFEFISMVWLDPNVYASVSGRTLYTRSAPA